MSGIRLLAGLGNPGSEYQATRHNAGYWWLDSVARDYQANFSLNKSFRAQIAEISDRGNKVYLLKSTAYMNESGYAISACARYYQITPEQILIAHDELDFAAGIAKFKYDGGHGGHNGLRDIIKQLNARNFYRFRIGIGHPGQPRRVHGYVLSRPSKTEQEKIETVINDSLCLLPDIMAGDMQKVMHEYHTKKD